MINVCCVKVPDPDESERLYLEIRGILHESRAGNDASGYRFKIPPGDEFYVALFFFALDRASGIEIATKMLPYEPVRLPDEVVAALTNRMAVIDRDRTKECKPDGSLWTETRGEWSVINLFGEEVKEEQ